MLHTNGICRRNVLSAAKSKLSSFYFVTGKYWSLAREGRCVLPRERHSQGQGVKAAWSRPWAEAGRGPLLRGVTEEVTAQPQAGATELSPGKRCPGREVWGHGRSVRRWVWLGVLAPGLRQRSNLTQANRCVLHRRTALCLPSLRSPGLANGRCGGSGSSRKEQIAVNQSLGR